MSEPTPALRRAMALNYFLGGAVAALLFSMACSTVQSNGSTTDTGSLSLTSTAFAQDDGPVEVYFGGPIEVIVVEDQHRRDSPLPVMICDGQEPDGSCANVERFGSFDKLYVE